MNTGIETGYLLYSLQSGGGLESSAADQGSEKTAGLLTWLAGMTAEQVEREHIRVTLELSRGNRERAADLLNISERTLYRKLKEYGLGGGPYAESNDPPPGTPSNALPQPAPEEFNPATVDGPITLSNLAGRTVEQVEKEHIRLTLEATRGNREQSAKMLGIGERTLYRKLKEYGLFTASTAEVGKTLSETVFGSPMPPVPIEPDPADGPITLNNLAGMTAEQVEKEHIRVTLELTHGNREHAAKMLGMGERTLYRKLKEYGLG